MYNRTYFGIEEFNKAVGTRFVCMYVFKASAGRGKTVLTTNPSKVPARKRAQNEEQRAQVASKRRVLSSEVPQQFTVAPAGVERKRQSKSRSPSPNNNDRDVANGERQMRSRGSSVDSQRSKSRSRSHSPFFDKEDRGSDGRDKWSKSP
ncbi:hypothetical protein AVEN_231789-1 [Araneus ventricosus]|uniref:Uncharacterized protein n=1 Tax=Araneus ventricosus TaxID=182803 RepID=A0A4Y2TU98_ARAVE|nr:hypothetical protein AVEN_231789-1 [Araneus ventricosus]